MSLYSLIGLVGLLYIVVFGALALFRREGLSVRFAVEALSVTAIAIVLVVVLSIQLHPVIFLVLLYIVTMRVRILVDLANVFARRGDFGRAEKIYTFASHMWPDQTNDLIVKVNHAIMMLQNKQLDKSIALLNDVLTQANKGYLGVKYEAATHYNLGVAYLRKDNLAKATAEFNAVLDTWPASLYAQRAQNALERQRSKTMAQVEDKPPEG